ncbi:MAG: metal-binding protein [Deltaproteobacteria bacterium]|nr:MAG: metal-binding protein [Deltaproteobacteria bacterium]
MQEFEKYIDLAKSLKTVNAKIISPQDIFFDIRAILKCRWGCEDFFQNSIRCDTRDTTYQERVEMVKSYNNILVIHAHDARELSIAVLEIERTAFLDGYYFAFAIRTCNLCKVCAIQQRKPCPTPDKVRPCDQSFSIDVYKTARNLGLPCDVLQSKDDIQNRYGFVLLD